MSVIAETDPLYPEWFRYLIKILKRVTGDIYLDQLRMSVITVSL